MAPLETEFFTIERYTDYVLDSTSHLQPDPYRIALDFEPMFPRVVDPELLSFAVVEAMALQSPYSSHDTERIMFNETRRKIVASVVKHVIFNMDNSDEQVGQVADSAFVTLAHIENASSPLRSDRRALISDIRNRSYRYNEGTIKQRSRLAIDKIKNATPLNKR